MYRRIIIVVHINKMLNNIYIEALSMMNPSSICAFHAIHQYVLLHKILIKVLLIKASTTWTQYFIILTEFPLNEAHKFFDAIDVFTGK